MVWWLARPFWRSQNALDRAGMKRTINQLADGGYWRALLSDTGFVAPNGVRLFFCTPQFGGRGTL
jgi:hypothetical protein